MFCIAIKCNIGLEGLFFMEKLPEGTVEERVAATLGHLTKQPDLSLPEIVRGNPELHLPDHALPHNIGDYRLVPMTKLPDAKEEDMYPGNAYAMPENVKTHYSGYSYSRPLLDGPLALGITVVKEGVQHLCAVGAVRVNPEGVITIVQLQGSITDTREIGPQLGGFRWAETLVQAWSIVGSFVGAKAIEFGEASEWPYSRKKFAKAKENLAAFRESEDYKAILKPREYPGLPKELIKSNAGGEITGYGVIAVVRRTLRKECYRFGDAQGDIRGTILRAKYYFYEAYELLAEALDGGTYSGTQNYWEIIDAPYELTLKLDEVLAQVYAAIELLEHYEQSI